jgi:hypothetical protein
MPAFAEEFNHNATVTRRVRLDLARSVTPPYEEWLKTHVSEVMTLTNDTGELLLAAIHSRMGRAENGSAFVTDFHFRAQAAFEYYNQHFLAEMRGRIEETYPGAFAPGSPFSYSFSVIGQSPNPIEQEKHDALLIGIKGFTDVARA